MYKGGAHMKKLLILGAGGYGRTVAEAAAALFDEIAFLDDGQTGPDILGPCADYERYEGEYAFAYPAFGNNDLRATWLNRLGEAGYDVPALVHPRAYVSPSAVVEPGAVVLAMACVGTHTLVRRGAIINMGAVIDHDCTVGFCVHAAPGAIVKAGNFLAPMTKVESGQVVERAAYPAP